MLLIPFFTYFCIPTCQQVMHPHTSFDIMAMLADASSSAISTFDMALVVSVMPSLTRRENREECHVEPRVAARRSPGRVRESRCTHILVGSANGDSDRRIM